MTTVSDRPAEFTDAKRLEALDDAKKMLRLMEMPADAAFKLAEAMKKYNEFGYARKLFGRIRDKGNFTGLDRVKIGQHHALCTYKDTDLAAADRFERALKILDEVDELKCEPSQQQETLGLRGAVYKRRWQVEGQRKDLLRSLAYYLKGYEIGPATDQGYTGINAAFVFDLLAREEAIEAEVTGTRWSVADDYWRKGRDIREQLAQLLPELPKQAGGDWLKDKWWFFATRAEAQFGIGDFDGAVAALREFNRATGLDHQGPPLELISPWEFESTISQLGTLAVLQADIVERLSKMKDWKPPQGFTADAIRSRAREALRTYLGEYAAGLDRAFDGKLGLALSGGGFRASLFHIGVLARLAEQDMLRRVEVLSCVSGGSIIGAHYYLELQHLLETKADGEIEQKDYVELVRRVEKDFLDGVQTNIRCNVFGDIWCNLRMFLQPGYTTTRRLGELYESEIYARIDDKKGCKPRLLEHLLVRPRGEASNFKPKYDNWRRNAKVPELVLNATTLNTGRNWQFTASWMGEPPSRLDAEIGGNYLLRRMYHSEAPLLRGKWRGWLRAFGPLDYKAVRVGEAVAASSCVPGLFEPLVLSDLFKGKMVRLVDGGVYDNQGVASLLEQDCNVMIVSDASGQMEAQDMPSGSRLGVPLRSFSVSMARARQAQFSELDARRRSGLLKGMMFLHMRKDLDAETLDWRDCLDPFKASDEAPSAARASILTSYGMEKDIQRSLSAIRTDLDSFTEVEAFALMTSGYCQADADISKLSGVTTAGSVDPPWRFLGIHPLLSRDKDCYEDLKKHLDIGSQIAGKVWRLSPVLKAIGIVFVISALLGLAWLCWTYRAFTLLTVGSLSSLVIVFALSSFFPHLVQLVQYKQTVRNAGLRGLLGVALALGFKFHRRVLDRYFLWLGSMGRRIPARKN